MGGEQVACRCQALRSRIDTCAISGIMWRLDNGHSGTSEWLSARSVMQAPRIAASAVAWPRSRCWQHRFYQCVGIVSLDGWLQCASFGVESGSRGALASTGRRFASGAADVGEYRAGPRFAKQASSGTPEASRLSLTRVGCPGRGIDDIAVMLLISPILWRGGDEPLLVLCAVSDVQPTLRRRPDAVRHASASR
jgi:hypothetical protein